MNLKKRIERLEARRPAYDPGPDAVFWRALATFGTDERERRVLLAHADAVQAGRAHGDPPEPIGALRGIRPDVPA